ncbi:MAG: hypothetical protein FWC54_04535 [Actinomycetia bacterium]|nr:hypothetical protein [Actinomycetes bacterium]
MRTDTTQQAAPAPESPWAPEPTPTPTYPAPPTRGDRLPSRGERRQDLKKKDKGGSSFGRAFRSFVLTILFILLIFMLAFSATFYARSRGWIKGKAPADPTVIRNMFKAL